MAELPGTADRRGAGGLPRPAAGRDALAWLRSAAPEITHIEVGAGWVRPAPALRRGARCCASAGARSAWLDGIARHGAAASARSTPGATRCTRTQDLARRARLRTCATRSGWPRLLGVTRWWPWRAARRAQPGDQVPHFGAGGWLPYLEGVYERQWEQQIAPYWSGLAAFAAAEHPGLRVCLELHPGTCVFNVGDVRPPGRARALDRRQPRPRATSSGWAWTATGSRPRSAAGWGTCTARTRSSTRTALALNGLLDRRWPELTADDAVDVRRARPGPRPGLVDWPGPGAVAVTGRGGVDRARGPVRA